MRLILPPIREIRLPGLPRPVNIMYCPGVTANFQEREHLTASRNPRRAKVEHKLQKRDKDCLHWEFITGTSRAKLPLSSMRNHYRRRWNDAFGKALKLNGLDYQGRKPSDSPGGQKQEGLIGTLEVRLFDAAHWDDKDDKKMIKHSDTIIKGLMELRRSGTSSWTGRGS